MKVPATKPYFSEEDITFISENFQDILRGKSFLSMYKFGEQFEKEFAAYIGTKFAVGCNSGTSALELICRALDLAGKEVVVPSNTFIATVNAILNAGATPVFADCGEDMCMSAADAEKKITPQTAAIMHVHIGGIVSPEILKLQKICQERKLYLIEDAAQAHGSSLNGIKAGAFGVAAGFSFFSTKVMTTGEGGMVTTNTEELVPKMKSMREFGKVKTDIYINYHTSIGYNWRLPEVSSLMGIRQLKSIEKFIERRSRIGKIYNDILGQSEFYDIIRPAADSRHNYYKYIVVLKKHNRAAVHKAMEEKGIQPSGYVYELPLHKQPVFPAANSLSLPNSERLCANHFCLPIYFGLTDEEAKFVAETFKQVLAELK